ncbi:MAG: efflux RND transporter periplasmic adaptor subunit [Ignavibacteriales bacterium]|nr:efflux RND transporter periplasmic adaptor subunit [Ignavibacteriales bacterium]
MYLIVILSMLLPVLLFTGCGNGKNSSDATGVFESEEVIISSEVPGILTQFTIEEGQKLEAGQIVAVIDTVQLSLKKKQLDAQVKAVLSKKPDSPSQLAALQRQIDAVSSEKKRFERLATVNAASQKQVDDLQNQMEILQKQYKATQSSLAITTSSLQSETLPLIAQIEQIQDQINRSTIKNPVSGTVISKYVRQNELTTMGKSLYKIADLTNMTLRAYLTGNQLAQVKLGQAVKVLADDGKGGFRELPGELYWISAKSEFTPKTIQTKDERANLVYAVKIRVRNDGYLKIGMYGEIKFL